jgi:hypothetical protein
MKLRLKPGLMMKVSGARMAYEGPKTFCSDAIGKTYGPVDGMNWKAGQLV